MSSNLRASKFEIYKIGFIYSTKLSMVSNNHRYYDPMNSSKLLSTSALNNLLRMNPYSSMIRTIATSFLQSTSTTSSHELPLNTKFNSSSTPSLASSKLMRHVDLTTMYVGFLFHTPLLLLTETFSIES